MLTIERVDDKVVLAVTEGPRRAEYPLTCDQAREIVDQIEEAVEEIETHRADH